MFSVVIPAYNEANVIGRCLESLLDHSSEAFEIIVVCNGCHDETFEIASSYQGVKVIETDLASKVGALNLGDSEAKYFPRVFLDADVKVTGNALMDVVAGLDVDPKFKVGAPRLEVDYSHSSWAVKAFYRVWTSLPYFKAGSLIGSGIFILTEQGRARFESFPDIIADDAYVRSLFSADERYTNLHHTFTIYAPLRLRELIKIKTRARFGNIELTRKFPNLVAGKDHSAGSLARLAMQKPSLILCCLIYVYVQLMTMRRAKHRLKSEDYKTWERDDSGRLIHE